MGKIVVHMAMAMSVGSVFVMPLLLCLPLHTLTFFSMKTIVVAKMKIFTGMANNDITEGDFCRFARAANGNIEFCETIQGHQNLQDMAQRFCVGAMSRAFRGMCEGLSAAYGIGLAIIIFQFVNAFLHIIALWSLYNYVYNTPKKVYRDMAFFLVLVGTCLNVICLGIYAPMVSIHLDNVSIGVIGLNWAIDISNGTGISLGYWIMWVAVMVQCMQLSLYKASRSAEERLVVEMKMQREFEAELAFGVTGRDFHVDARGWFNAELASGVFEIDKTASTNPYAQNNQGLQPLPSYRGAVTPVPAWRAPTQSSPNYGAAPAQSAWPTPASAQYAPQGPTNYQSGGGWPASQQGNYLDPGSQGGWPPSRQVSGHLTSAGPVSGYHGEPSNQDGWPPSRQVSGHLAPPAQQAWGYSGEPSSQGGSYPAQPGSGYLPPAAPQVYLVPPSFDVVPGSNSGLRGGDSGMPGPPVSGYGGSGW